VVAGARPRRNSGMDSGSLRRQFGAHVQALREGRRLTQEGLAAKISRSVDTISNIERGINATKLETASHIARALDIPLSKLFDFDGVEGRPLPQRRKSIEELSRLLAGYDDRTVKRVSQVIEAMLKLTPKKSER